MQISDVPKTTFNPKVQWWTDANWLDKYDRYLQPDRRSNQDHHRILDRRFTLQSFAASVRHLPGATVECGVHRGTGSALICATLQGSYNGQKHYGFDSFEGLPEGGPNDANWKRGQLAVPLELARKNLAEFADICELVAGWIPDTFTVVSGKRFRLVHIDVDLELPTQQSLEFFYARAIAGALFIIDDYCFHSCPGARLATQQFLADRPETIVELTTGQAIFYKHGSN